jgi:hypothetical protein
MVAVIWWGYGYGDYFVPLARVVMEKPWRALWEDAVVVRMPLLIMEVIMGQ